MGAGRLDGFGEVGAGRLDGFWGGGGGAVGWLRVRVDGFARDGLGVDGLFFLKRELLAVNVL